MKNEEYEIENSEEDGVKTRSLRISKASLNKINEIKKELGGSHETAVTGLINLFELENAKGMVVDRKAEIEQFQMHSDLMVKAYINSMQMYVDVEDTVKEKFKQKLESNQEVIEGLQGEKSKLLGDLEVQKRLNEENSQVIVEQEKELKQFKQELKITTELCEEYKTKNDTLIGTLTEYAEDREKQKELKAELERIQTENQKVLKEVTDKEQKLKNLENQLEQQEKQNQKERKLQEDQNKKDRQLMDQQAESNLKMAVLNTKEEYNTIIEELKSNANKEYRELLEQLEELRKENHRLEKSLLQIQNQKPTSTRGKKKVEEKPE